jgi:hypothetical protein
MKRTIAFLALIVLFTATSAVYALYSVNDKGDWPQSWPKELEPLRKQARTLVGPMVENRHYEIPFTKREEFEAAWPHLLAVKSKGGAHHPGTRAQDGFHGGQARGGSHPLAARRAGQAGQFWSPDSRPKQPENDVDEHDVY